MDYSKSPEYYSVRPKVVKDGVPTEITIKTAYGNKNFKDEKYIVEFRPMQNINIYKFIDNSLFDRIEVKPENGVLKFTYTFNIFIYYYI